jgi:hypothetical protein
VGVERSLWGSLVAELVRTTGGADVSRERRGAPRLREQRLLEAMVLGAQLGELRLAGGRAGGRTQTG